MKRVVDASVAIKWFTIEDGHDAAKALIGSALVAPELLVAETASTLWRKVSRAEIGAEQAGLAQSLVRSYIDFVSCVPLAQDALDIALRLDHPAYDCFYLALALQCDARLVTADKRLIVRCKATQFEKLVEPLA